jgi:hypothetical protein
MKAHLSNVVCCIVDYAAYSIGMLMAALAKTSLSNSHEVCA